GRGKTPGFRSKLCDPEYGLVIPRPRSETCERPMFAMILSMFLTAFPGGHGPGTNDAQLLIDTIESLQKPVEDFRCEFEGTLHLKGKAAENVKVGDDGLYESFSGTFIWKRGGDTRSESLFRRAADNQIARDSLVVRMSQQHAEQYHRLNDAALG